MESPSNQKLVANTKYALGHAAVTTQTYALLLNRQKFATLTANNDVNLIKSLVGCSDDSIRAARALPERPGSVQSWEFKYTHHQVFTCTFG